LELIKQLPSIEFGIPLPNTLNNSTNRNYQYCDFLGATLSLKREWWLPNSCHEF